MAGEADFSPPVQHPGAGGNATVAVCVLGAPRSVIKTYSSVREHVVKALKGDAFIYVPFPGRLSRRLEDELAELGPAVTAIAVPDIDGAAMEARFVEELFDSRFPILYMLVSGPWRAPAFQQMGSSMWGYHMQYACRRMVEAQEARRGHQYDWVIFARADFMWLHKHPPIPVLDPGYVHVPFGQDNSYYNGGSEPGLNDRHAAIPRHLMEGYLGRWEALSSGAAWSYMHRAAAAGHLINTEQYLLLHLQGNGVPVRRFPPVAFVAQCQEGPQCQHLYRGTTLGKQRWTSTGKYWTELVESRRTIYDELVRLNRVQSGWIWAPLRPHTPIHPEVNQPWQLFATELACCLSPGGPVSCYWWLFLHSCRCLAARRRSQPLAHQPRLTPRSVA